MKLTIMFDGCIKHELELNESIFAISIWGEKGDCRSVPLIGRFNVPKKIVKKWRWKLGSLWYTKEHYSTEEIRKKSNMGCMEKVEGSEIEVEV